MKNIAPTLLASTFLALLPACDVPLPEQFVLKSTSSLPEGVAYDGVTHTFFATAINGGQITRVTPLAQEIVFHTDADPKRSFGGAHVDEATRRLWVCVVDVKTNPWPTSQVWAFNIESKTVTHKITLPFISFCNDLVTDDDGTVYATDSANPAIYKIDPKTSVLSTLVSAPEFAPLAPGAIGLNGLDISPDGERLLVVKTIPAAIYSVPLADPQAFVPVLTSGDNFGGPPGDPRFPGPDGAEFLGDQLYVVYDGGVQQLSFAGDDWTQAAVKTTTAVPSGLTSATVAEDQLYVIDSEVFRVLYLALPPILPFTVSRVDPGLFEQI
ncbi:MAG: SMP-30/gluconolactonase/LRE family protein [Nannocystis sp.]|nr:SMP-30/gluconolactonase/LRE family protein [Nannocystis sp.]MBA3549701.1 SMP-30/gluconolactonase/LRE family protein [Nannocystis sp.]